LEPGFRPKSAAIRRSGVFQGDRAGRPPQQGGGEGVTIPAQIGWQPFEHAEATFAVAAFEPLHRHLSDLPAKPVVDSTAIRSMTRRENSRNPLLAPLVGSRATWWSVKLALRSSVALSSGAPTMPPPPGTNRLAQTTSYCPRQGTRRYSCFHGVTIHSARRRVGMSRAEIAGDGHVASHRRLAFAAAGREQPRERASSAALGQFGVFRRPRAEPRAKSLSEGDFRGH
jgi:hypothetical protein